MGRLGRQRPASLLRARASIRRRLGEYDQAAPQEAHHSEGAGSRRAHAPRLVMTRSGFFQSPPVIALVSGGTNSFFRETLLPRSITRCVSMRPPNAASARPLSAALSSRRLDWRETMLTTARKRASKPPSDRTCDQAGSGQGRRGKAREGQGRQGKVREGGGPPRLAPRGSPRGAPALAPGCSHHRSSRSPRNRSAPATPRAPP